MGVKKAAAAAVYWTEGVVRRALASSKAANSNIFLTGNFEPVTEESIETDLQVIGEIPVSLSGAFIRNGPNPQFPPAGGYHWFDGDGMLHSLRLKDGKAVSYANHWVRTHRFEKEREAGIPTFNKIGDLQGAAGLPLALIGVVKQWLQGPQGTANTALEFHAGRLLALHEGDAPVAVRLFCEGALESLGSITFGGKLAHPCTAHPKVCPNTGDFVFFGYHVDKSHVDFSVADSRGEIVRSEPVQFRFPQMVHDFAITDNYAVFMDLCLLFDPKARLRQSNAEASHMLQAMVTEGNPFRYDKSKGARFGLVKRGAQDREPIQWFDAKGCFIFHTVNAWEEARAQNDSVDGGKRVKLIACRTEEFDLGLGTLVRDPQTGRFSAGDWKGGNSVVWEYTFDLETGATTERELTPLPEGLTGMDFPRIHPALTGKPVRFCFCATLSGPITTGAAKIDVATGAIVGRIEFPPGCFGSGDPVFVPAGPAQSAWSASQQRGAGAEEGEEDEGYLLTYVTDETKGNAAELWIMDARTMDQRPLARVAVPKRIPYGFHGTWVSEQDIQSQWAEPLRT